MKTRLTATLSSIAVQLQVDETVGVIRGCSVMTAGQAKGWPFTIDLVTLQQTADAINSKPKGVAVRFKHPATVSKSPDGQVSVSASESLGTEVGYLTNARIDGDKVRGDVQLAEWSDDLPGLGNVRGYLLKKAIADPTGIGLSAMFEYAPEIVADAGGMQIPVARVSDVRGVDFVAQPAANPNGLLSELEPEQPQQAVPAKTKDTPMTPEEMDYMKKNHGLKADATDEEADAACAALSEEDKAKMKAACAAPAPAAATTVTVSTPAPATAAAAAIESVQQIKPDPVVEAERVRVAALSDLAGVLKVEQDVVALAVAEGDDVNKARVRYLAALAKRTPPVKNIDNVQVGEDKTIAALASAIPDAVMLKSGVNVKTPHELAGKMSGMRLIDMGRKYLAALGVPVEDVMYLSPSSVVDVLGPAKIARKWPQIAALAQSSSSFANLLVDATNKSLRAAYELQSPSWTLWARRGTAPDFKNITRVQLSDVPTLVSRSEGEEIKYYTVSDSKETGTLVEYAMGLRITRKALINDDTDAFSRIPQQQAATARLLENTAAYGVLTANANMSDGYALFSSTHLNLDSATSYVGAPSITTIGYGRKAMRTQTGPKGNILNIIPKFLIVPAALEGVAEQMTSANYVASAQSSINPFAAGGRTPLTPIVEPLLDTNATAWYLAADPAMIDTVEVVFLDSEPAPVLKQETDFDTDDVKMAVRHTLKAMAIDHRGLYKNNGTV